MSGTRHKVKELWNREDEVEDLRDEKEQHRFAEMSEDCDDSKRHSSEVAVRVANKHAGWIPGNNIEHSATNNSNSKHSQTQHSQNKLVA